MEIISKTAVCYFTGLPAVPICDGCCSATPKNGSRFKLHCVPTSQPNRTNSWFVSRWPMGTTFQEIRQRLSFETQRHWSEMAILSTTLAMLGLFCVVVLFAHRMMADQPTEIVRRAAWYDKRYPTFSEVLALVRKELWVWQEQTFSGSPREDEMVKVSQASESTL